MGADGNLLAGWEQSAGLRAPPAPDEGVLAPNGTGYLLAVGSPAQRLYPRAASAARWTSALAVPAVAAMPFLLVPAPYGFVGVAALGAFACWLPGAALGWLARARLARRLERAPVRANLGGGGTSGLPPVSDAADANDASGSPTPTPTPTPTVTPAATVDLAHSVPGALVRLEGVVAEQATVASLFANHPVVLATSDCAGVVETRGIDFDVRLGSGEIVRVPARDAVLLGRPHRLRGQPSCGPLTVSFAGGEPRLRSALLSTDGWVGRALRFTARELTLGPGDPVEICGVIDFEADGDAQRGFGRGPALRAVVRPAGGLPIIVRKREPDADGADGASRRAPGTVTSAPR